MAQRTHSDEEEGGYDDNDYNDDDITPCFVTLFRVRDRLVVLVIKASASRVEDPEFESRLRQDFSGVESYQ